MTMFAVKSLNDLHEEAYKYISQGNYSQAVQIYEQAISAAPDIKSSYWYLGLIFLLQGQVTEAQTTWMMAIMEGDESATAEWTEELRIVLEQEAIKQGAKEDYASALIIRQQIQEICGTDIINLLHLVQLKIQQESYTGEELIELDIITILQSESPVKIDWQLLISVLNDVLNYAPLLPSSLEFAKACISYIHEQSQANSFINVLLPVTVSIAYTQKQPSIAAKLLEVGLKLDANNRELLCYLAGFYFTAGKYQQGIETAKLAYSLAEELPERVFANNLVLRGFISSGGNNWQEAHAVWQKHELLLKELVNAHPLTLASLQVSRLFNTNYFTPYFYDQALSFRTTRNLLSQLCQANVNVFSQEVVKKYQKKHLELRKKSNSNKLLKIGYLSHCFSGHSVGWLARWLIKYHDRNKFEINGYFISCDPLFDHLHEWYLTQFNQSYKHHKPEEVAEQIFQDEIDILIDLDSITLDISCQVLALKPAPIQATWLGWDASGIPTIDYFIADPYVLPESADEYYSEKIWRLPQTYIAVDGFEVGVPTLRRDNLNISADAVVYFSGQRGFKRHPDTARLQMKIIKEVPNSYFLIKGDADEESIKSFFYQLAEEEGVAIEQLRFLPGAPSEAAHRANLGIADIVLDTYPYNGATTTLETLWMGIPLVTRVGEQFAARNSYTMMVNAGITEGIAWTDAEYVEWGVRLGKDENLRQQVATKLKMSRQTAPLWNGKQFAREMEKAYEQMWQKYCDANNVSY